MDGSSAPIYRTQPNVLCQYINPCRASQTLYGSQQQLKALHRIVCLYVDTYVPPHRRCPCGVARLTEDVRGKLCRRRNMCNTRRHTTRAERTQTHPPPLMILYYGNFVKVEHRHFAASSPTTVRADEFPGDMERRRRRRKEDENMEAPPRRRIVNGGWRIHK